MIADGSRASAEFRGGYILNTAIQEYTHACQCKGSCVSVAPPFQCEANMLTVDIAELYACVDGMSSGTSTEAVLEDGTSSILSRLTRPKPASIAACASAESLFQRIIRPCARQCAISLPLQREQQRP